MSPFPLLGAGFAGGVPKINVVRQLIYRFDPDQRIDPQVRASKGKRGLGGGPPTLPLAPLPESIRAGRHYVVNEVVFTLPVEGESINWKAFVDVQTGAVLYLRAGVAHATGMVYLVDPMTATGNTALTPAAPIAVLDPLRTSVMFVGLDPPVGPKQIQHLSGTFIRLEDRQSPTGDPPTQPPPHLFNGSVNSDMFAAANAYHNCDRLFRLVASAGLDVKATFDGTTFPVRVDHRGFNNQVNAQAPMNSTWTGSDGFIFGLAGAGTGVPISADWRVVLHEFGHTLLEDAVHFPNFGFSHSAGDSLAAIVCDPDSQLRNNPVVWAKYRGLTFPWVSNVIDRRHDRRPPAGWGWGGVNDNGGYDSEQILSSTLFRLYCAMGGDSPDLATRQLASRYTVDLIIRGIFFLATDPPTPTDTPDVFESKLMDADMSTPVIEGLPGGGVHKMVRWAFEKQGLHRLPGVPPTSEGAPPPVDVYIDDGRHGEYLPFLGVFWETADIWNRIKPDGGTVHQNPIAGAANFIYVRVKNRGTQAAHNVTVRVYHSVVATGLHWPKAWKPTTTPVLPVPGARALTIASGGQAVVGPFQWTPVVLGHACLLASVSATDDLSNIDPLSPLPVNTGPTPHVWLVPFDNNIAQRNVVPVPAGNVKAFVKALQGFRFRFCNPLPKSGSGEVRIVMPKILAERDWKVFAAKEKGTRFTVAPGAYREIELAVEPGRSFTGEEILKIRRPVIEVHGIVDGMMVGGISFTLEPGVRERVHEGRAGDPR